MPRRTDGAHTDDGWWLTPARAGSLCDDCGHPIPKAAPVAYNRLLGINLCALCAERRGLKPKPSANWNRMVTQKTKQKRRRTRKADKRRTDARCAASIARDLAKTKVPAVAQKTQQDLKAQYLRRHGPVVEAGPDATTGSSS